MSEVRSNQVASAPPDDGAGVGRGSSVSAKNSKKAHKKAWVPKQKGGATRQKAVSNAVAASVAKSLDEVKGAADAAADRKESEIELLVDAIAALGERLPPSEPKIAKVDKEEVKPSDENDFEDLEFQIDVRVLRRGMKWVPALAGLILLTGMLVAVSGSVPSWCYDREIIDPIVDFMYMPPILVENEVCIHRWTFLFPCVLACFASFVVWWFTHELESEMALEKYRVVRLGLGNAPLGDLRSDVQSFTKLRHNDPQLALATFSRRVYDHKYDGQWVDTVKVVSLELLSQLLSPSNLKFSADENVVFQRFELCAATIGTINSNRFDALKHNHVYVSTVALAYAYYKKFRQDFRYVDFPNPAIIDGYLHMGVVSQKLVFHTLQNRRMALLCEFSAAVTPIFVPLCLSALAVMYPDWYIPRLILQTMRR